MSSKTRNVIKQWPNKVLENIVAIHAASGRDIVSALSGIGKTKFINSAIKSEENIYDALAVFNLETQEQDTLLESSLSVIQALYSVLP